MSTDRPIGKVFEALRKVEKHLEPMFAASPESPFSAERKKGGLNISIGSPMKKAPSDFSEVAFNGGGGTAETAVHESPLNVCLFP